MDRRVAGASAVLAVGIGACSGLGWTFAPVTLPVGPGEVAALPAAGSVDVALSVLPTARVETQHGLSVRGASVTAPLTSAMVAFVVDHPRGRLLIDAGMGRNGVAHVATTPMLMQLIVDLELEHGTADALAAHGVEPADLDGVLLTHSHWDHVSGLEDLPGVPVWTTVEEKAYLAHDEGALLYRQIDEAQPIDLHVLVLDDGPYGPFERSLDWFDDGSVVVVPMPGHTPGSIGVFVNLASGPRYLFIGDTAWAGEGVSWPAEKPWIARRLVDKDAEGVRSQLDVLHRLARQQPELVVVPAHDERVHAAIPRFPAAAR